MRTATRSIYSELEALPARLLVYVALLGLLGVGSARAQSLDLEWVRTAGGTSDDRGDAIATDGSNNVYVAGCLAGGIGSLCSPASSDLASGSFLSKYDEAGGLRYTKPIPFDVGGFFYGGGLAADEAGNTYLTGGSSVDEVRFLGKVAKYDPDGDLVWEKTLEEAYGYDVGVADGGVYVTGIFEGDLDLDGDGAGELVDISPESNGHVFVAKYDLGGDLQWARAIYADEDEAEPYVLAVDEAGSVYVSGSFLGGRGDFDGDGIFEFDEGDFLAKYDAEGRLEYVFGAAPIFGLAADEGGVYAALDADDPDLDRVPDVPSGEAGILAKFGDNGELLWARGANGRPRSNAVAASASYVYVTGSFSEGGLDFDGDVDITNAGERDAFVAVYEPDGTFVSARSIGGSEDERGYDVAVGTQGEIYVTGFFEGEVDFDGDGDPEVMSADGADAFIAKYVLVPEGGVVEPPVATDDEATTRPGEPVTIDVLANDADPDGGILSIAAIEVPIFGTATLDASGVTYTPPAGFNGQSAFTYTVRDDEGGRAEATVRVIVLDPETFVWARTIPSDGESVAYGIATDEAGNAYVTGRLVGSADLDGDGEADVTSRGGGDVFLAKFAPDGALLWARRAGGPNGDRGNGVAVDGAGNAYVVGTFGGEEFEGGRSPVDFDGDGEDDLPYRGFFDAFLAKYSAEGEFLWARSAGGPGIDLGYDVAADEAGNAYIVGAFLSSEGEFGGSRLATGGTSFQGFLAKYDQDGTAVFGRRLGDYRNERDNNTNAVAVDAAGNAYVTGYSDGPDLYGNTEPDFEGGYYVAKFEPDGTGLWIRSAGGDGIAAGDDAVYAAGQGALSKFDLGGELLWAQPVPGENAIALGGTGDVFITGGFRGSADLDGDGDLTSVGEEDVFVAQYDPSGMLVEAVASGGAQTDVGYAIAVSGSSPYVAGESFGGLFVARYAPLTGAPPTEDATAPECEIVAVESGPPATLRVRVRDTGSGLASIDVRRGDNAEVAVPAFERGSTEALTVVATKRDPGRRATVVLEVLDVAGNATVCDPVVTDVTAGVPEEYELGANYPNPFNPATTIRFGLPEAGHVRLVVYDVMGREVAVLTDELVEAGTYAATWDGRDAAGRPVASGLYLYRIEAGSFAEARTMTLLK